MPQILTNRADVFLEIAKQLRDMGYEEANLNLGCPSGTVTAKHRGAGFLEVPDDLAHFLDTIYEKCPISISIKTRIGVESLLEWENLVKLYQKFPIKELIIHARFLVDQYEREPKLYAFQLAQQMLSCPLCYNGDIKDAASFQQFIKECPDAKAVMLGRGAIADPALSTVLKNMEGCHSFDPQIFPAFHDELLAGYREHMSGDLPVLYKMKELWNFWSLHFGTDKQTLRKIRKVQTVNEYKGIVRSIW